jgi:hypothetical protein
MEFLDVVNETVVKVLTTQVSVTGGCLTSKIPSPIVKRNIKASPPRSKMSTLHLPFTFLSIHLLVETIGDSSSERLVYDNRVLGSLLMGVAEVRGDGNDSVVDGVTQVRLEIPWSLHGTEAKHKASRPC